MKKVPLVSIIMNCYNGEKYLKESIKSILLQTYPNWELIFWNNKSTDNSEKIIKKFKDQRIKYYKSKKFLNLYESRNLAIKKSRGKYITFLDVDDQWLKTKLNNQVSFMSKNKKSFKMVYSNFYINDQTKKKKYLPYQKLPSGKITQKLLNNYSIGILTVLIDKDIFLNNKFNKDYNIIGDFDFIIKISQKISIGCIQKPLAIYRLHNENYSKQKIDLHINELKNWVRENENKLKKYSYSINAIKKTIFILKFKRFLRFLGV